ncbi:uncharacterized protein EV420DRAFT_1477480 [Desarmillaria tabescens]|uniref:Uncharacterized protein n=1 Tax=Armillaria tabescens TaxID=1929756 RepID=A0AA39N9Z9_ARMTA|nr:uncharacterized protein EV420DRAFT_1477480 [Desarmillaria tabescens]KAK0461748.1 hypothetical protein EV420DRAFT_1477480 [Desarmillaria tabescens]
MHLQSPLRTTEFWVNTVKTANGWGDVIGSRRGFMKTIMGKAKYVTNFGEENIGDPPGKEIMEMTGSSHDLGKEDTTTQTHVGLSQSTHQIQCQALQRTSPRRLPVLLRPITDKSSITESVKSSGQHSRRPGDPIVHSTRDMIFFLETTNVSDGKLSYKFTFLGASSVK